jgi:hypothetical protein
LSRYSQYLFTGFMLALIGWAGLALLFIFTQPTLGPRWLFYFLILIALSGTALPIIAFFHLRFPGDLPVDGAVIVRQAIWVGVFADIIAWLQLGRILSSIVFIFLAGGFILIEFLLRLRERSRWKPGGRVNG